jgi:uncharacterized protein YeaO (DUF488 family)
VIRCRRAYEEPREDDGVRVLVDRYWPRGVSKEELELDAWRKELAPSDELREWFDHDPDRWKAFRERYHRELEARGEAVEGLLEAHRAAGTLTLVYAARDTGHNNAVALRDYLRHREESG